MIILYKIRLNFSLIFSSIEYFVGMFIFAKIFKRQNNNTYKMIIDLSAVSDDGLALILLRMPVKDLLKICTQVSKQWNAILSQSFFWRDKMDYDGYRLEWPKLVGISTKSFQCLAMKHCFGRNFIKDIWDLNLRNERCLTLDPRWNSDRIVWQREDSREGSCARIEIPPVFLDGQPEISPEIGEPIVVCLATGHSLFTKRIVIKLADEGLTDDIMDNFRPTIIFTEMVANRRDCGSLYQTVCSLDVNGEMGHHNDEYDFVINNGEDGEFHREHRDPNGNGLSVGVAIVLQFGQWQSEGWNKVEHTFKNYPTGIRYLKLRCSGRDRLFWAGHYGVKLANCSVKALFEKNAE